MHPSGKRPIEKMRFGYPTRSASVVAWSITAFSLLVSLACNDLVGPDLPASASRFSAPPVFATWWEMTQSCSARTGSFSAIAWYVVPDDTPLRSNGSPVDGYWSPIGNKIVMKESGVYDGAFVRHEMLHALTGAGHTRTYFLDRCGGTVSCGGACLAEAGAAPPIAPGMPKVPADSLELSVVVDPASPVASANDGYFSVTVKVRNPAGHPVFVEIPPAGDAGPPGSFSYDFYFSRGSMSFDDRVWDNSIVTFAAGETKIHIFDFFIDRQRNGVASLVGADSVRVGYGERWLPKVAVTVRP